MLIDICIKFPEKSLRGFQVIERTQFVTDRQSDGQTDARGKTICLPSLKGGDIIIPGCNKKVMLWSRTLGVLWKTHYNFFKTVSEVT